MALDARVSSAGLSSASLSIVADGAPALLMRIRAGDRDALCELHETLGWLVYGKAHHITRERLAAELITAGVFALVWQSPHEFAPNELRHTLTQLAGRRAHDWVRTAS
jgi:hypothetical protein